MDQHLDIIERVRRYVIPKLGVVVQFLEDATGDSYYVTNETHNNQFVGKVELSEDELEAELNQMGFERNPLASLKTLSSTGEQEEGSWRKVGFDDYPRMQLHLILYDGSKIANAETGEMYLYAHWELRWDTDPIKHYRGEIYKPQEGVRRMKDLLDQNGIPYTLERPPQ